MTTVAIAEDQLLMLNMLAEIINRFEGFRVLIRAANGIELIEQIRVTGSPDILLLDLSMPQMGGQETAVWMRTHYPATKIIVLSSFHSDLVKVRLLRTGIRGFLNKDIHPKDLEKAFNGIKHQNAYFLQEDVQQLVMLIQQVADGSTSFERLSLTDRELEYIKLCCSDDTNKEIAEKMKFSPRTIKDLADGIRNKIGVEGRVSLVMYAISNGLIYL